MRINCSLVIVELTHTHTNILWPPYVIGQAIYIFILWFLLSSSVFFSSPNLSGRRLDVYHTSIQSWCGLSVNLECRSETCCARLAENTSCKKSLKGRHLGTIPQLCRAISSQLRHVSSIDNRKKLVKQQYLLHMSS